MQLVVGSAAPLNRTRTPVVPRIALPHHCANLWEVLPERSTNAARNDSVPSTIVYSAIVGMRKKTVRHQWYGGSFTLGRRDADVGRCPHARCGRRTAMLARHRRPGR